MVNNKNLYSFIILIYKNIYQFEYLKNATEISSNYPVKLTVFSDFLIQYFIHPVSQNLFIKMLNIFLPIQNIHYQGIFREVF